MSPDSPPAKKNKKREAPKDKDKDKDPNAPKKPANAFFMYCQQQRTVMQDDQKDPNIGHHELTKSLAKEWNNLATDDKKVRGVVDPMRGQLWCYFLLFEFQLSLECHSSWTSHEWTHPQGLVRGVYLWQVSHVNCLCVTKMTTECPVKAGFHMIAVIIAIATREVEQSLQLCLLTSFHMIATIITELKNAQEDVE